MTVYQEHELHRRRAIHQLARLWPSGWTRHRGDEYHAALADIPHEDITTACQEIARTWDKLVMPPPAVIRRHAIDIADQRHRDQSRAATQAQRAHTADRDRTPAGIAVTDRECNRPGCHGKLTLLTGERMLWCGACRSVQSLAHVNGRTRVTLHDTEIQELALAQDSDAA